MENLSVISKDGILVTDSREVAQMIDKEHFILMRDIRTYISQMGEANKENTNLNSPINPDDYFIESNYINSQNKKQPCYLLTKIGCNFVANKMTGVKGTAFTAVYTKRFDEMEKTLTIGSTKELNSIDHFKKEQMMLEFTMNKLKTSEVSKIKMIETFNKSQGLSTAYLPTYVDEKAGKSATELLKQFNADISVIKFNQFMIQQGLLEEKTRNSTNKQGFKKYKALTDKGLKYGKNEVSTKGSAKETQPLYYEDTFEELLSFVSGVLV